jgi:hypothetical protein
MNRVVVAVGCGVAAIGLTGCASSPHAFSARALARTAPARFPSYGVAFRYPMVWSRLDCNSSSTMSTEFTFIWSQASHPSCSDLKRGGRSGLTGHVSDGQLWVHWSIGGGPGTALDHALGSKTRIGGQPARVGIVQTTGLESQSECGEMGGREAVLAAIKPPGQWSSGLFEMTACLGDQPLGPNEAAVRKLLASVRFYPRER